MWLDNAIDAFLADQHPPYGGCRELESLRVRFLLSSVILIESTPFICGWVMIAGDGGTLPFFLIGTKPEK